MSSEHDIPSSSDPAALLNRIGQLTRQLRDGLRELGLDRQVALAAEAIPDSRDRLKYIAAMTEQAAERALNAVDAAQPHKDHLTKGAASLKARWESFAGAADRQLVAETVDYLGSVPQQAGAIGDQLNEIMMAQSFQDLTGQVIKKMMDVINEVETQLLQVLVDHAPKGTFPESDASLMNGPQIKANAAGVSGQAEADALLESLGF